MKRETGLRAWVATGFLIAILPSSAAGDTGQRLFEGAPSSTTVTIAGSSQPQPAERLPCLGCHGRDGEGSAEGSVVAPSISPDVLGRPRQARPAYDSLAFLRAVRDGVDPSGRTLDKAMPRYAISQAEADDLRTYLGVAARRDRIGIAEERIAFAVLDEGPGSALLADSLKKAWASRGAPRIWGREVAIELMGRSTVSQSAFAVVFLSGSRSRRGMEDLIAAQMPILFPMRGAHWGALSRGLQADEPEQLRRLMLEAGPEAAIIADNEGRELLSSQRLAPVERVVDTASGSPLKGRIVMVASAAAIRSKIPAMARGTELFLPFEDAVLAARAAADAGVSVVTVDPRPSSLPQRGSDRERMASVAAFLIEEALARSGHDVTRSRFLKALGGLKLADPAWPELDYQRIGTTGTKHLVIRRDLSGVNSPR